MTELKINDPLLDIAKELEEVALKDDFHQKLYGMWIFAGILYRAMGVPVNMLTVIFIGRLPGWLQWKRLVRMKPKFSDPQIYIGPEIREFVPIENR